MRSVVAAATVATLLALLAQGAGAASPPPEQPDEPGPARGLRLSAATAQDRVLVRWHAGVPRGARAAVLGDLADRLGLDRAPGPVVLSDRVDALDVGRGRAATALGHLRASPHVEHAEADHEIEASQAADAPDDPLFDQQWALVNTGQEIGGGSIAPVTGEPGVDVRALDAWATATGEPSVVVAVIDTGVDDAHPDLDGAVTASVDTIGDHDGSLLHGTAVASVVAARAGGTGMVGIAPDVSVLSIAAFRSEGGEPGSATLSSVVAAFTVAGDEGADVVNASWVTDIDSPLLRAAVAEAGVPVVAASGNGDPGRVLTADATVFPAGYDLPNVVTVTAVDPRGEVPAFANVGDEVVDVAAPGARIVGALPDGAHGYLDGTSFAAPFVSGALALAAGVAPYATTGDLVDAVSWTSRPLPSLVGAANSQGLLDAAALVSGVQRPVCRPDRLEPSDYDDVAADNAHVAGIDCVTALGIVTGRPGGGYDPAATVTREQLAAFVDRLVTRVLDDVEAGPPPFEDVAEDAVHAGAIARLASLGIVTGEDGRFRPRETVTRGQIASVLARTHALLTGEVAAPSRRWFDDTGDSVHVDTVDRARDLGLLRGVTRVRFDPGAGTRRDQMASLLAQTVDALARGEVQVG